MTAKKDAPAEKDQTEPVSLSNGLALWETVSTPRHEHTKSFSRGGGFKGTSVSVTAMAMMATEVFGPNGIGWGVVIEDENYVDGHQWLSGEGVVLGHDVIHVIRAHIWYVIDGEKYETSPQFGQTTFVGRNKNGPFTDEEAPKKSISDVQNKCLSLLGFASDIFLGKWDDQKYVNEVKQQQAADDAANDAQQETDAPKFTRTTEKLSMTALKEKAREFYPDLDKAQTDEDLALLAKEYKPMVEQLRDDLPSWYFGDENQEGMKAAIESKSNSIKARAA